MAMLPILDSMIVMTDRKQRFEHQGLHVIHLAESRMLFTREAGRQTTSG